MPHICVLTEGIGKDKRTMTEATFLNQAGFNVTVLTRTRARLPNQEIQDGIHFVRVFPTMNVGEKKAEAGNWARLLARSFVRLATPAVTYTRMLRSALKEGDDGYHGHSSFSTMVLTWLTAKVKHKSYFADYNDAIAWISNQRNWDVVGIDITKGALPYVKCQAIIGGADRIPFRDNSFDMVLSTETLEHLPPDTYSTALKELRRVSSKYLLIEVPHRQQLGIGTERCINCDTKFHANFHFRTSRVGNMRQLFDRRVRLVKYQTCSVEQPYYCSLLLWIRHQIAGRWAKSPYAVCPWCGTIQNGTYSFELNDVAQLCNKLNKRIAERR